MTKDKLPNQEEITYLSELRASYSCFDEKEEPFYRALSKGIEALRKSHDPVDLMCNEQKAEESLLRTDDNSISNEDVIYRTEDDYWYCKDCDHAEVCRYYPMDGCDFKDVASAQPHWILCSERLPEIEEAGTSRMVLLCWTDGQVTVGAYAGDRTFVGQAWPKAKGASVRVIAWMPLPAPFREDEA